MLRWSSLVARATRRQQAQGLTDFALTLPFFLTLMMVGMQLGLLFMAQLSVMWLTQNMARYVATGSPERWRFPDSCQFTYRNSKLPPLLLSANFVTATVPTGMTFSPAYTPTTSDCNNVGNNSPAATAVTPPRIKGSGIRVTLQYNPANLRFIPSTFFGTPVLTTLPAYTAGSVME